MALAPPFFVISDTHWYHRRIGDLANRPENHESLMVKRWAKTVKADDVVLHLGDLFFGGTEGYVEFHNDIAPKLPGRKYIILGNHDKRKWDYEGLGFTVLKPFSTTYRGYEVTFDHYPKLLLTEQQKNAKRIHVHGHIHNHGYSRGEEVRWGNVNVSVEAIDYRPQRVSRLLNQAIRGRNQGKPRFRNARNRWQKQRTKR